MSNAERSEKTVTGISSERATLIGLRKKGREPAPDSLQAHIHDGQACKAMRRSAERAALSPEIGERGPQSHG